MSLISWIKTNRELIGTYTGSISLSTAAWVEFFDIAIRWAGGIAGLTLTIILIIKALRDMKKSKT